MGTLPRRTRAPSAARGLVARGGREKKAARVANVAFDESRPLVAERSSPRHLLSNTSTKVNHIDRRFANSETFTDEPVGRSCPFTDAAPVERSGGSIDSGVGIDRSKCERPTPGTRRLAPTRVYFSLGARETQVSDGGRLWRLLRARRGGFDTISLALRRCARSGPRAAAARLGGARVAAARARARVLLPPPGGAPSRRSPARSALARRAARRPRRAPLVVAMWSVDEPGSLDDYEFSSDLGLRRFYRERKAFDRAEWHADTLQRKAKDLLERVDRSGVWTVGTTFGAIAISALDSLFDFGDAQPSPSSRFSPRGCPTSRPCSAF